jgi:integrative and conjugative element protein (TIGR02256 family)
MPLLHAIDKCISKVWLARDAYTQLLEEAIRKMPLETGGILLGYWGSHCEVVVTKLVGPGPKAIHKEHSFAPDTKYHETEISRHYDSSERKEIYLGDWHTHPFARAYLSEQDRLTIKNIADYAPARLNKPIMMILGTMPFGLSAWTHTYEKGLFRPKPVITECIIEMY